MCLYGAYGGSGNEESGLYDGDDSDRQGRDRFQRQHGAGIGLRASLHRRPCRAGRRAGAGCAQEFPVPVL